MKLQMVKFQSTVLVNSSNHENITAKMVDGTLRFEDGFVAFEDKKGTHRVPLANVKRMTVQPKAAPAAKAKPAKEPTKEKESTDAGSEA